jgi:hypothetical protein
MPAATIHNGAMPAQPVPAELLDPVVAYFHPRRGVLFGSLARGDTRPDSDIDLLVILDDDAPREKLTLAAGYAARQGYRHAADVIPCRESVFQRKRKIAGTLAHQAATEGVVVYERQ